MAREEPVGEPAGARRCCWQPFSFGLAAVVAYLCIDDPMLLMTPATSSEVVSNSRVGEKPKQPLAPLVVGDGLERSAEVGEKTASVVKEAEEERAGASSSATLAAVAALMAAGRSR
jgi:hypothetical protein